MDTFENFLNDPGTIQARNVDPQRIYFGGMIVGSVDLEDVKPGLELHEEMTLDGNDLEGICYPYPFMDPIKFKMKFFQSLEPRMTVYGEKEEKGSKDCRMMIFPEKMKSSPINLPVNNGIIFSQKNTERTRACAGELKKVSDIGKEMCTERHVYKLMSGEEIVQTNVISFQKQICQISLTYQGVSILSNHELKLNLKETLKTRKTYPEYIGDCRGSVKVLSSHDLNGDRFPDIIIKIEEYPFELESEHMVFEPEGYESLFLSKELGGGEVEYEEIILSLSSDNRC